MPDRSKDIKARDERAEANAKPQEPEMMNEDGSVTDIPARKSLERQLETASTSPNERLAADHSVGTPAWVEENSPDHLHSDGGSTLAPEQGSTLDVFNEVKEKVEARRQEQQDKREGNKNKPTAQDADAQDK